MLYLCCFAAVHDVGVACGLHLTTQPTILAAPASDLAEVEAEQREVAIVDEVMAQGFEVAGGCMEWWTCPVAGQV